MGMGSRGLFRVPGRDMTGRVRTGRAFRITRMKRGIGMADQEGVTSSFPIVADIVEDKLEEIVTLLGSGEGCKSRLYDDVLSLIERGLIRIALRRSNNIKMTAADFLGISRNTLHNKMVKLKINNHRE